MWLGCAACSGLDTLDATCGNGVVETGEDCDSGSNCRQCSITCDTAACPSPYVCGADQLCHAAGGRFRGESAAIPFEVQGFGITDINGDGYGDVVSLGGTSFTTYDGNAAGTLVDRTTLTSPVLQGQPAVTNLDPGPTLDLVLPTVDGLLAYTSPAHVPSPYPFPVDITPTGGQLQQLYVFPISKQYLGLLVATADGSLGVSIVNGDVRNATASITPPVPVCNFGIDKLAQPLGRDDYVTATSHLVVLTSTQGVTCEIEVTTALGITSRTVAVAVAVAGTHAWFARLETPGLCPSLLIETAAGMVEATAGGVPNSCTTSANTLLTAFPPGLAPLGHVVLDPAQPDALATTGGIFVIDGTGAIQRSLYTPVRPMDSVATVDINGDGLADVIASSRMFDDLDVLVRYGAGVNAGFLPRSIDTVGVPLNVLTGDFDGDGVGDVTYTEKLAGTERLMIAFGGHDAIEPARFVSSFTDVIETSTINLASSSDPNGDRVVDLIVLDRPTGPMTATVLLTVLFGNPERTLLPFFDPRVDRSMSIGFHGVIAGTFDPAPSAYQDLFAIEETFTGTTSYLIEPSALGAMSVTGTIPSPNFVVCRSPTHASGLCIDGSRFATFRSDASQTHDLVFGLDADPAYDVVLFDPFAIAGSQPLPMTVASMRDLGLVTAANLDPHRVYVADIDGDGTNELVAGYGPDSGGSDKTVGTIVVCNATGSAIACHALSSPDLAGWACGDATPANVVEYQRFASPTPRISADLVAVCRRPDRAKAELLHIWFADAAFHAEEMFALPLDTIYVTAGDVTGDGIDDILAFEQSSPVPLLHIYPQCTSRDRDGCPKLDGEP